MIKKLGLLSLLFMIFGYGISFANPIAGPGFVKPLDICYKLKNTEIDDYKVIIEYGKKHTNSWDSDNRKWEIEPNTKECIKCSDWRGGNVYLLDKNINIENITEENIDEKAIFVGNIRNSDCTYYYDETRTYEIINRGGKYRLEMGETKTIKNIKRFPLFWLGAIMLETLILFYMAKLFWKENEISNKKLLLFGIIPTTVTLPLLWFVLPLLLGDGIWYTVIGELLVVAIESIIIKYGLHISWMKSIITSFICNLFSFILSYDSLYAIILILLCFIIKSLIVKLLRRNDEISNKRLILVGIFGPIVSVILSVLLIWIIESFRLNPLLLLVVLLFYIVLEVLIIKYGLKISRKKAIIAFILSVISLSVFGFVLYLCLGMRFFI